MKETREFLLDFTGCGSVEEIQGRIRDTFGFPQHYGENLDALWDMGCDYLGLPNKEWMDRVRIRGVDTLTEEYKAYVLNQVLQVFRDIEGYKGNVKFELEG